MKNWVLKTKLKNALFFLTSFSLSFSATLITNSCQIISQYENSIFVYEIIDGDTFSDGKNKYRILGIDTPETYDTHNHFKPTIGPQFYYGNLAKNKAISLLNKKAILAEIIKKDKYQRFVVKINIDNYDYGLYMVSNGYAITRYISNNKKSDFYYYDNDYIEKLKIVEENAKKNKIGFWSEPQEIMNKIFP